MYLNLTTPTLILNYQYRLRPTTQQKLVLNDWLRVCRYWYNKQLGERFYWWQYNRSDCVLPQGEFCQIACTIGSGELKDKPDYYNQKKQLPIIKEDLVKIDALRRIARFYDRTISDATRSMQTSQTSYE